MIKHHYLIWHRTHDICCQQKAFQAQRFETEHLLVFQWHKRIEDTILEGKVSSHYNMCYQTTTQNVHGRCSILLILNTVSKIKGQMPTLPIYLSKSLQIWRRRWPLLHQQLLSQSWSYLYPGTQETYSLSKDI